ncbi:MAG: hypothetical protein E5Y86_09385 [Mesorhizobium sp.]|nr:MAG: hypothetical protein E5Y86_09385 [Mesorhizobium sp.]
MADYSALREILVSAEAERSKIQAEKEAALARRALAKANMNAKVFPRLEAAKAAWGIGQQLTLIVKPIVRSGLGWTLKRARDLANLSLLMTAKSPHGSAIPVRRLSSAPLQRLRMIVLMRYCAK